MNLLKKSVLLGALVLAATLFGSFSEAKASRLRGRQGGYAPRHYKTYHFTGRHRYYFVAPPNRFRKKIVNNASYRYRPLWLAR